VNPIELCTPAEMAEIFGTTERGLIRFARKHRVPIVEMKRGVYRFTEAAILQLQEAAQARSLAPLARSGRSGSWTPASHRVRKSDDTYASARALMVANLQKRPGKKPPS
jgi:hypothetical protein